MPNLLDIIVFVPIFTHFQDFSIKYHLLTQHVTPDIVTRDIIPAMLLLQLLPVSGEVKKPR
jgi:hypothetical protein